MMNEPRIARMPQLLPSHTMKKPCYGNIYRQFIGAWRYHRDKSRRVTWVLLNSATMSTENEISSISIVRTKLQTVY